MKSIPVRSSASRENRFNVTNLPGSTAYPPSFVSPVAQGMYIDPSTPPQTQFNLSTKHMGPKALTDLLSESISEALTDLLGNRVREAIYDCMERKYFFVRNEIPEHLDSLFALLEGTFGVGGKKVIGRTIAKKVYAKLDWEFVSLPNLEFADYLERIKTKIISEALEQATSSTRSRM